MTDTGSVPLSESEASNVSARRRTRGIGRFLLDILIIFVVALLVSFLIKTFLIRSFYIPSGSMETTLQINDRIIVNELAPGAMPLHRGDVVVFTDPGGWLHDDPTQRRSASTPVGDFLTFIGLSAADSDNHLVKRVIGLPGDHVVCCTALGQIAVNGVPIKEPYITIPPGEVDAATVRFDVTVPAGALWVMGDNRYNSRDSSLNQNLPGKGFVPESAVVGRAVVISWPLGRWTVLGDYPEVFADVPDAKQK